MKKKTMKKVSSLALASTLVVAGLPFQSAASAATLSSVATNLHKQVTLNNAFKGGFISPKLDTASTENVKVIVTMSAQPTAVGKYAASEGNNSLVAESSESAIKAQQASVVSSAIAKGIDLTVNYQFNTILNGMEISIPANKIPELAKIPGVVSVFENSTYYAIPDQEVDTTDPNNVNFDITPLNQLGVPEVWAKNITGKGLKVGVIDTGVDYLHPDLAPAYKGGHNSKTTAKDPSDPYEDIPIPGKSAGSQHGTHVSGTIAGRAANTSDLVQKGVAYEADLYSYKVLGYNPATGRSSGSSAEVIDGIERAVKDGMDVINLSLGSDGEKDPNSPDSIAINNAVLAGVTAVVANGNAADKVVDQYYYSMGSPASSQLAISVGASTSPANNYKATVKSSLDAALDYNLNVMGWRTGAENFAEQFGTAPLDAVYVGLGNTEADYTNIDATGKVVLLSRGSLPFVDKVALAKKHGAKAVIIFNGNVKNGAVDLSANISPDRDGNINSFLGDSFELLPTFDMAGTPGRALAKQLVDNGQTSLQFTFGSDYPKTVVPGDRMASFSSRGPASDGKYGIKPDIAAPGVNILSTWPAYGKANANASYTEAYNRISGTSMATPHVAGLALLIKQAHPDWTPFDIRSALANTADEISDTTGKLYDVYSQGAGRANVAKAIETNALLQTVDALTILDKNLQPQQITNYNDNASFGLMEAGSSKSETLQLKNTGDDPATYSASVKMHPSVTGDLNIKNPIPTPDVNNIDVSLTGLTAGTITAGAKSAQQFGLTVAPKATAVTGVYEGEVLLEAEGKPSLHIPFSVHVGDSPETNGFGLQDADLSHVIISPDGDGVNDTTDVKVNLTASDVNYFELNAYGVDDELVGNLRTVYTEAQDGSLVPIAPGIQTFPGIDGSYTTANDPTIKHLAPGTYKLEILAAGLDKTGKVTSKHVYTTYKTMGVSDPQVDDIVKQAAAQFQANITNTTQLNKPVLSLPTAPGLVYEVTSSSNLEYISYKGDLLKLPTAQNVDVDLNVRIASATNPSMKADVKVTVHLNAPSVRPFLVQSGTLSRVGGVTAKVNVVRNQNVEVYNGNAVVVFQLMKGTTPVSLVAVSKGQGASEVMAQFNVAANTDYWVKAYVVDAINSVNTSVPTFLGDIVELR